MENKEYNMTYEDLEKMDYKSLMETRTKAIANLKYRQRCCDSEIEKCELRCKQNGIPSGFYQQVREFTRDQMYLLQELFNAYQEDVHEKTTHAPRIKQTITWCDALLNE